MIMPSLAIAMQTTHHSIHNEKNNLNYKDHVLWSILSLQLMLDPIPQLIYVQVMPLELLKETSQSQRNVIRIQ